MSLHPLLWLNRTPEMSCYLTFSPPTTSGSWVFPPPGWPRPVDGRAYILQSIDPICFNVLKIFYDFSMHGMRAGRLRSCMRIFM